MTSKAHAEFDPGSFGIRLAVQREHGDAGYELVRWEGTRTFVSRGELAPDDCWMRLPEDDARAIYEALGDFFGHAGHDIRALRKDYDAEQVTTPPWVDVRAPWAEEAS